MKLSTRSVAHIITPILVVVGAATIGTYMLVASHAATANVSCSTTSQKYKGSSQYSCQFITAPVLNSANVQVGSIAAGLHWVVCQQTGGDYHRTNDAYSNWWAYAVADNGTIGWVNASYGNDGTRNGAYANVPNCNGALGSTPTVTVSS
jgi:hypothetical protein